MANPIYIFVEEDGTELAVHPAGEYVISDGDYYVKLGEPIFTLENDGTDEQWRESLAKLDEWLATYREGRASSQ